MFDRLLMDRGIQPVVKQATSVQRPPHHQLQQLAQLKQLQRQPSFSS
jgi:hypothetical protein